MRIWKGRNNGNDYWRKIIKGLSRFLIEKGIFNKVIVESFDKTKNELIKQRDKLLSWL